MEMTDLTLRIKQFMDQKNMTVRAFANSLNENPSKFSHLFNNRNQPSLDLVMKIKKTYPELNLEWLLEGNGEMQKRKIDSIKEPTLFDDENEIYDENIESEKNNEISATKEDFEKKEEKTNYFNDEPDIRYGVDKNKAVKKIMVFYSDKTYEEFLPAL